MSKDNISARSVKIEKGIVSVNAYGYYQGMVFPLKFKIFKPKGTLKKGDKYQPLPELGAIIIKELNVKFANRVSHTHCPNLAVTSYFFFPYYDSSMS